MDTSQMRPSSSQLVLMVKRFLTWIECLITMALSMDMIKTVSTLAEAVLTVMKPKLWQTVIRINGTN